MHAKFLSYTSMYLKGVNVVSFRIEAWNWVQAQSGKHMRDDNDVWNQRTKRERANWSFEICVVELNMKFIAFL